MNFSYLYYLYICEYDETGDLMRNAKEQISTEQSKYIINSNAALVIIASSGSLTIHKTICIECCKFRSFGRSECSPRNPHRTLNSCHLSIKVCMCYILLYCYNHYIFVSIITRYTMNNAHATHDRLLRGGYIAAHHHM